MVKNHNLILHRNAVVTSCPTCKNNTEFNAVAIHCCDEPHVIYEIHVQCICGFDPTALLVEGYRHQNGPGESEEASVEQALATWNAAIVDIGLAEIRKAKAANLGSRSITSPALMILEREDDLLAWAFQVYQQSVKRYGYDEAVHELQSMATEDPASFYLLLPELRRIAETRESFDTEEVAK